MRDDPPGSILRGGDIDNRLKTLFDALKMPREQKKVGDFSEPEAGEDPFFCLLEDDALITRATVETDTLLAPVTNESKDDARVIVTVTTQPYRLRGDTLGFG